MIISKFIYVLRPGNIDYYILNLLCSIYNQKTEFLFLKITINILNFPIFIHEICSLSDENVIVCL